MATLVHWLIGLEASKTDRLFCKTLAKQLFLDDFLLLLENGDIRASNFDITSISLQQFWFEEPRKQTDQWDLRQFDSDKFYKA